MTRCGGHSSAPLRTGILPCANISRAVPISKAPLGIRIIPAGGEAGAFSGVLSELTLFFELACFSQSQEVNANRQMIVRRAREHMARGGRCWLLWVLSTLIDNALTPAPGERIAYGL